MADHDNRTPPMLPDEVRKAVEAMDLRFTSSNEIPVERASIRDHEWAAIKANLLAREAENARLRRMLGECYAMAGADTDGDPPERHAVDALAAVTQLRADYDDSCGWQARAERAEALLRECHARLSTYHPADRRLADRITARLSENSRVRT